MTFKKESVTFVNYSDNGFLVEVKAGDGSTIKRHVTDEELVAFCSQHGFDRSVIEDDIVKLRST